MWIENITYLADLEQVVQDENIFGKELEGKTILITGATGLVGQNIVNALLYFGMKRKVSVKVLALVRSEKKAQELYKQQLQACGSSLGFVVSDVTKLPDIAQKVDYIIHGASQTASSAFVKTPVETIETAIVGTKNMLELARSKRVTSFVYLSSMEAYGSPTEETLLSENAGACFDSMSVRSCYPESKRMCEALCAAYAAEYNIHAKVIRLAQTFGLGVSNSDARVFADFARKALKNEDIVMQTKGDSSRMYLYTMDAVTAILTVLQKGEKGACYNAANKETYCSIKEMAELVSDTLSEGRSKVTVQIDEENIKKYPPAHKLKLDTTKLENLGWHARYGLDEMYRRMVSAF